MKIDISSQDGLEVVSLEGEIDLSVSPRVRSALLGLFHKNIIGVVVDMSKVLRVDSAAIATMVECLQYSREKGKAFALVSLQEHVFNTLRLARLNVYFRIFDTLEEALAEFS